MQNRIEDINLEEGVISLELGCGEPTEWRQARDYIRIDKYDFDQDIVWDIEKGIPIPDSIVDYIYCSHVFEHLKKLIFVMNECHRILKPTGQLQIVVPTIDNRKAYVADHVRYFNIDSFDWFSLNVSRYGSRSWQTVKKVVNERGDLHVTLKPIQ